MAKQRIGFIGQGFIGKHMADDFEARGYRTVRYALEAAYADNKQALQDCEIIFVAVPTPTTPKGFDLNVVINALEAIPDGAIAVIKSTIIPGSTALLQQRFPAITVLHSPEFLREKYAAEDTAHPERNIIGITDDSAIQRTSAMRVMALLPKAPYSIITLAVNAECIKYIGNTFLYTKLVFMNLAHEFVHHAGADWEQVREAVVQDSRIGTSHTNPLQDDGRGAGGHCFIKDFQAFLETFAVRGQTDSVDVLEALRNKNNDLLVASDKDIELLRGVYGDSIPQGNHSE